MDHSWTFLYIFRLFKTMTVQKCPIEMFTDGWIRITDPWFCKRPLVQLRHNHCPTLTIVTTQFGSSGSKCLCYDLHCWHYTQQVKLHANFVKWSVYLLGRMRLKIIWNFFLILTINGAVVVVKLIERSLSTQQIQSHWQFYLLLNKLHRIDENNEKRGRVWSNKKWKWLSFYYYYYDLSIMNAFHKWLDHPCPR